MYLPLTAMAGMLAHIAVSSMVPIQCIGTDAALVWCYMTYNILGHPLVFVQVLSYRGLLPFKKNPALHETSYPPGTGMKQRIRNHLCCYGAYMSIRITRRYFSLNIVFAACAMCYTPANCITLFWVTSSACRNIQSAAKNKFAYHLIQQLVEVKRCSEMMLQNILFLPIPVTTNPSLSQMSLARNGARLGFEMG